MDIKFTTFIEPVVLAEGFEFVGVELITSGNILRVYVDKPGGITLDDCASLSRQISAVLDAEPDLINGKYFLEVSSPGLNRIIFSLKQMHQQIGKKISLKLLVAVDGKQKFSGVLEQVRDNIIHIKTCEGLELAIDFADIAHANVIFS